MGKATVSLQDSAPPCENWRTRKAELTTRIPEDTVLDAVAKTLALLDRDGAFGGD